MNETLTKMLSVSIVVITILALVWGKLEPKIAEIAVKVAAYVS
jgi:hypothetical protein